VPLNRLPTTQDVSRARRPDVGPACRGAGRSASTRSRPSASPSRSRTPDVGGARAADGEESRRPRRDPRSKLGTTRRLPVQDAAPLDRRPDVVLAGNPRTRSGRNRVSRLEARTTTPHPGGSMTPSFRRPRCRRSGAPHAADPVVLQVERILRPGDPRPSGAGRRRRGRRRRSPRRRADRRPRMPVNEPLELPLGSSWKIDQLVPSQWSTAPVVTVPGMPPAR